MKYILIVFYFHTGFSHISRSAESLNRSQYPSRNNWIRAETDQFSYLVRIYSITGDAENTCMGSILSYKIILTAAQCCEKVDKIFVVSGKTDVSVLQQQIPGRPQNRNGYFMYPVDNVIVHPLYARTSRGLVHDVCLLLLSDDMQENQRHTTTRVSYKDMDGVVPCTVIMWGSSNETDETEDGLFYKNVNAVKKARLGTEMLMLLESTECVGDTGGPLVCNDLITGINSYSLQQKKDEPCKSDEYFMFLKSEEDFLKRHVRNSAAHLFNSVNTHIILSAILMLTFNGISRS